MSQQEQAPEHATDLKTGPFAVLYNAVKSNTQVLVNVRNNHKLLARVKAYDRHMNLCVVVLWLGGIDEKVCRGDSFSHSNLLFLFFFFSLQITRRREGNVDRKVKGRERRKPRHCTE
jgi:hypothetical protein